MIGPVSETGRTMMASLQQAMSKGMPVDQAIAYVKSMAKDGVAPLVDLYALMKQFQRMKQQQVQPPQTPPTIRDQLNMLEASQSQGQGGLPAALPQQNPQAMMGQGLGGLPAGRMENPQFAGGGIVAFDEGGQAASTPQFYSPIPEFKSYDEMAEFYNRQLQDPKMIEQEMARREAVARQQKMDEYAPSFGMRESLLAEDKAAAERRAAEDAQYDRDEYWGDVAANAAESGATLLSSLAKAQKGKASRKRATAEKAREAIRAAKQSEILLQQAREAEKEGRFKDAEALRAKAAEAATSAREKSVEAKQKREEAEFSRETQLGVARIYRPGNTIEDQRAKLLAELTKMRREGRAETPEYANILKLYNESGGASGRSGNLSVMRTLLTGAQRKEANAKKILNDPIQRKIATPDVIAQAEADLEEAQTQIQELLGNYPELQEAVAPRAKSETGNTLKYNPATGKIE